MGIRIKNLKDEINYINSTIKENLEGEQKSNFWLNNKNMSIRKVQKYVDTIVEVGDYHFDENGKFAKENVDLKQIKQILEEANLPELNDKIEQIQTLIAKNNPQQNIDTENKKDNDIEFESYNSNMGVNTSNENIEFEPYDSNMVEKVSNEKIGVEPDEVSQEESKKNKAINAFKSLVSKFKQLTSKKEKIEGEMEKRPNIDKKQVKEDAEKSGKQTIFQRFKGLVSRHIVAKKNLSTIESAMRERDIEQFISDSKDVAKENLDAAGKRIKDEAVEIKSQFIDNYNDIKNGAKAVGRGAVFVGGAVASGAIIAGDAAWNGFKTAGMVTIGGVALGVEALDNARKDMMYAAKTNIGDLVNTGREKANGLLDKLEDKVVEIEEKSIEQNLNYENYTPKSFRNKKGNDGQEPVD